MREYLAIDAASASRLKMLARSPLEMIESIRAPYEETEALRQGHIVHVAVLEPERYEREFVVMPDFANTPENRTGDGKQSTSSNTAFVRQAKAAFERANAGKQVIEAADHELAISIRKSLKAHKWIGPLLDAEGVCEQTVLWYEEIDGMEIPCKARADKRLTDPEQQLLTVLDLKTTRNASPVPQYGFEREIWNYRYDIPAAMYLSGLGQFVRADSAHFFFVAVEKKKQFAHHASRLMDAAIEKGQQSYRRLLKYYHECNQKQEWPMWSKYLFQTEEEYRRANEEYIDISLPTWAFNEWEGEE